MVSAGMCSIYLNLRTGERRNHDTGFKPVIHQDLLPVVPEPAASKQNSSAVGWESQLLETGFLGIFLCPLWTLSRLPRHTPPSSIVIWGFRWLIFRIMLGAGLIKIRGDRCWRELTCMDYHYETQPVPNPIAYFMHRSPWWFHQFETLVNHFIELVVPFFLFLGRRMCIVHGLLQILFQVLLIVSGNLSFLNWLTIVPSIACFDDSSLGFLFSSRRGGVKERVAEMQLKEAAGEQLPLGCYVRKVVNISFGLLIAYLSIPVVLNLLNSRQVMNTSFNPLRIVNTYGAFGSITKERTEVVLQGTSSLDPNDPAAVWEEYDFKCKPGDLKRRPCFITPYHYRLDWLMWFAAFQVDPRGTLQVQIQPTRGKARQRGEVVDSEEDRPLLPPRQPPGPEEVLRRQELAVPRAGLMEEDEQGQEGPAGEEEEQSAPLNHMSWLCLYFLSISLFTHILQKVPSQPVHLLLWSGFSHLSASFCSSFSPRPRLMIDFFCQAAPFRNCQL
ncbi:lipase maturation factor 1 isoform 1-T1 [Morphnus guianensis]